MTIYIANFDTQWKNDNLEALFSPYGQIESASVMLDLFTDRSRGFGYVEMPNENEGNNAIASLHQKEVGDKVLVVKLAEPVKEAKGSYKVGSGGINPYRFKKN